MPPKHPSSFQKAFSLIEAAIVLGVVGLIIGGIWVAAAAVRENLQMAETLKGIAFMTQNVKNIFGSYSDADLDRAGEVSNQFLIDSGIVPRDWVLGTTIASPFNGTLSWQIYSSEWQLSIQVTGNGACNKLARQLASNYGNILTKMNVVNADISHVYTSFPFAVTDNIPECDTDSAFASQWHGIDLYFRARM